MEKTAINLSKNVSFIMAKLSESNLLLIAEFLDFETIQVALGELQKLKQQTKLKIFFDIIFVKFFIEKYLHDVDRSNYMTIYQERKFKEIENQRIKTLWLNGHQKYRQIQTNVNQVKNKMKKQLHTMVDMDSLLDSLFNNLKDPLPPNLNLRKTEVGNYCNSGFQFYMISKRFPETEKDLEESFIQLKNSLDELRNQEIKKGQFELILNDQCVLQKIKYFYQNWFQLNLENYDNFLIDSKKCFISTVHNTMVYLMVLFDSMIEIVDYYLQVFQQDQLHYFVEFNMRYALFRNSLLELQVQLGFLYEFYNEIIILVLNNKTEAQRVQNKEIVKMFVWRCLLSKWFLHMKKRHNDLNFTYCYLFKKMNYSHFSQRLQQRQIKLNHYMMPLTNNLQSVQEDIQGSFDLLIESPLADLIENDQLTHQLLKQYVEYMVDTSVNEDSVHWCGHSEHELHVPYQEYSQLVVDSLSEYLQKIYKICNRIDNKDRLFVQIVNNVLEQMDKEYLKPVTLKKLIKEIKYKWVHLKVQELGQDCSERYDNKCNQNLIIKQIDFSQRDKRLEHFNSLQKIPNKFNHFNNIVIEIEDLNNWLKNSADTNCTQEMNQSNIQVKDNMGNLQKSNSIKYEI